MGVGGALTVPEGLGRLKESCLGMRRELSRCCFKGAGPLWFISPYFADPGAEPFGAAVLDFVSLILVLYIIYC